MAVTLISYIPTVVTYHTYELFRFVLGGEPIELQSQTYMQMSSIMRQPQWYKQSTYHVTSSQV